MRKGVKVMVYYHIFDCYLSLSFDDSLCYFEMEMKRTTTMPDDDDGAVVCCWVAVELVEIY